MAFHGISKASGHALSHCIFLQWLFSPNISGERVKPVTPTSPLRPCFLCCCTCTLCLESAADWLENSRVRSLLAIFAEFSSLMLHTIKNVVLHWNESLFLSHGGNCTFVTVIDFLIYIFVTCNNERLSFLTIHSARL